MRILVLSDNFTPEIVAPSFRTHEHAKVWVEQGHEVTVVTCVPNWPSGKVFDGYKNRLYQEEWIDGIRVIRLGTYITANRGFFKRTLDYISFMAACIFWCWRFPRFDVVLATSPQFFTAVAGWIISVLRRRPWIFELRDLWPDSIRAVGASNGRIVAWLERLELFLYRRATRIVALTNAFKANLVGRGISAAKIDVVTNGVDLEQFDRRHVRFDARRRLGIRQDEFLTGYLGTTGMAHGLETVIEAARLCRDHESIRFVIIGEGAERERLETLAAKRNVKNVRFANRVPHEEMPSYLAAFDLPIIHLRPDPLFKTVIPSKLFEFMAMGRPVLMAVEGECAGIVRETGCGACIPSGHPLAMSQAVKELSEDPASLARMGNRGRIAVEMEYNRSSKALAVLNSLRAAASVGDTARTEAPTEEQPSKRKAA